MQYPRFVSLVATFSIALTSILFLNPLTSADEIRCMECHEDVIQKPKLHSPAADKSCDSCHTVKPEHFDSMDKADVTTDRTSQGCFMCHDSMPEMMAKSPVVHGPLKKDDSCLKCHNPHGSSHPFFIKDETQKLCLSCHTAISPKDSASRHGVIAQGKSCVQCHQPHFGAKKKLLTSSGSDCLSCHNRPMDVTGADGRKRVIPDIKAKIDLPYAHSPAADTEGCTQCHDAHAAKHGRLLTSPYPDGNYTRYPGETNPFQVCFNCHSPDLLKKDITGSETTFRNDVQDAQGRVSRQNLHYFHVLDPRRIDNTTARSCSVCHDPHGATQAHNLKDHWQMSPRFSLPIQFTPSEDGGSCAKSCHTEKSYRRLK